MAKKKPNKKPAKKSKKIVRPLTVNPDKPYPPVKT